MDGWRRAAMKGRRPSLYHFQHPIFYDMSGLRKEKKGNFCSPGKEERERKNGEYIRFLCAQRALSQARR